MTGNDVPVAVLVGATAVGKSDVAIRIARRVGAEVIACDALTVYRRLDVLTAKPAVPLDVPHHLLDVVEPWESYSAARFVEDADRLVREIRGRGRVPLVVGGTALYAKSFLFGLGAGVGRDPALRAELEVLAQREGTDALVARLAARDPARAAALHKNDVRRLVRAVEIVETTGRKASELLSDWQRPPRRAAVVVGLRRKTEDLHARIDARARAMLARGAVEEVTALDAGPRPPSPELSQALGLDDVRALRDGRLSLGECAERLARSTRRFAKRQATFFRQIEPTWIEVGRGSPSAAFSESEVVDDELALADAAKAAISVFSGRGAIPPSEHRST